MTKTSIPCYQPSGSVRPIAFLYFALATVAGVLISFVYQWLVRVIPFVYLNLLTSIGFGVVLGLGGYIAVRKGHCRNRILAIVLAVPLAVIPLIASYYWDYRYLISEIAEMDKANSPPSGSISSFVQEFPDYVAAKEEIGWKVGRGAGRGQTLNGKAIFLVWGIEALLVLGSVYLVISSALRDPYCEDCGRFCDQEKGRSLYGLSATAVNPALEREDLNAILSLPASGSEEQHVIGLTCNYCATCNKSAFLSVRDVWTYGTDKKGNPKTKTIELINHAILSPDQRNRFLSQTDPSPAISIEKIQ